MNERPRLQVHGNTKLCAAICKSSKAAASDELTITPDRAQKKYRFRFAVRKLWVEKIISAISVTLPRPRLKAVERRDAAGPREERSAQTRSCGGQVETSAAPAEKSELAKIMPRLHHVRAPFGGPSS